MISHWAHPNAHPGVGRHTGVLTATRLSVPVVFPSMFRAQRESADKQGPAMTSDRSWDVPRDED